MNNKQFVEKRIRELIPELALGEHDMVNHITGEVERVIEFGNIHLEHVLRAIHIALPERTMFDWNTFPRLQYDLTKPFNNQSEELYNFLAEILLDNK